MEYTTLNNGIKMPVLGIGTYTISPMDTERSVKEALLMGYRMVDTANMYGNERAVGRAIKASGVDRKDIFVSTKLWISEYKNGNSVEETLERLGLDYIDLLFLHQPAGDYISGYRQLENAYEQGKIKAIGISNFYGKNLEKVLTSAKIKPQVIQCERHPYYIGKDVETVLKGNDIKVMAWYPLGHGDTKLTSQPVFSGIGKKYGKSPVQVILRWHLQMGFCVIPGSKNSSHIRDNFNIFDFELSEEDMQKIAVLDAEKPYFKTNKFMLAMLGMMKPKYEKI